MSLKKLNLLLLLGLSIFACTQINAQNTITTKNVQTSAAEYLFVIRAETCTVSQNKTGQMILTLNYVDPDMLYFSDRPVKVAGLMATNKFIMNWKKPGNGLITNPPNAALVHGTMQVSKTGIAPAIAIQLSNPIQVSANTWKFTMKNFSHTSLAPGKYKHVSLFIDDIGLCESGTNCNSPFPSPSGGPGYNTGDN